MVCYCVAPYPVDPRHETAIRQLHGKRDCSMTVLTPYWHGVPGTKEIFSAGGLTMGKGPSAEGRTDGP